ncbi:MULTISPECIES: hypothetical protein [Leptolyngbya]|nr:MULTISPECIES: hypothetical protein [Leptolyngbya]MBD2367860.1 hypothetical protein [Leptolyngbya sp. FACHB-161]MBD2374292.1 hypothetical protein [Leptolyngbya sp. FACHB-238]MBD2398514.1 hypothetical protein [Leptolyngbya sp. FACHB-239]MBD2406216.1 hypothetical protein [Leptolyngbya sp. FACHB-402]ULP30667.1 hypothetical protein MCP04_02595 [Leptolyngbya boryana IU 594]
MRIVCAGLWGYRFYVCDEIYDLLGNFDFGRYLREIVQPAVALLDK